LPFSFSFFSSDKLLEMGKATSIKATTTAPAALKIVSYNMRWRGGTELRELIELLRASNEHEIGGAMLVGLQEVDRNKRRTNYINTAQMMAEALGLYYAWAAPPPPTAPGTASVEDETGVAILSAYPLTEVVRIVLPNAGPGGRRRVALGATVRIGRDQVRIYSIHAETRISVKHKLEQFQAVIDDVNRHPKVARVIVLGDFNTWEGDAVTETTRLFTNALFSTPFLTDQATWRTFLIELKLDWIWMRGLRVVSYGIDRRIGLSDHWPLWAVVKLNGEKL
jgi:endonuclease/exonuclease/phosphatase family metal-dependent hydrolase